MTETAKERNYREALEEINNLAIDVAMDYEETEIDSVDCGKLMDIVNMAFSAETNQQPINTNKLSVEKLEPIGYYNEAHGFLYDESDKDCYCQGGCSMEAVYTESQVKKLIDELSLEKLKKQLQKFAEENERLRNALEDIRTNTPIQELLNLPFGCACHEIASDALATLEKGE